MAQNVTIAGAQYSAVPAVDIPKTGGGTARFMDTSDANAVAADIADGKTAYVNGAKVTGTATGGAKPEQTKTASYTVNGTYDVTPDSGYVLSKATVTVNTEAYLSDNLHNFATDVDDIYINTDGTIVPYAGWQATDFIPVDNTSFYFLNKTNTWYGCYDANKNFVSFAVGAITQFSNPNIKYFRASFSDADMANFNMQRLIVGEIQPNIPTQSKTATANGDVYPDAGHHLAKVTVAIPYYEGW